MSDARQAFRGNLGRAILIGILTRAVPPALLGACVRPAGDMVPAPMRPLVIIAMILLLVIYAHATLSDLPKDHGTPRSGSAEQVDR